MNKYEEFLIDYGCCSKFPKKDSRILFKVNEGKIYDVLVEYFPFPGDKDYLYKEWPSDIGNCLSDWDQWNLIDVLMKLFFMYKVSQEAETKIYLQLCKIEEFRNELAPWIYRKFYRD